MRFKAVKFRMLASAMVAAFFGFGNQAAAMTLSPIAPTFVLDGAVSDIAVDGEYTYLAGSFASQRTPTGGGLITDATGSGAPDPARLPKVAGSIRAAVADGNGGWYVGGSFTAIGNVPRAHLARVLADGTVDPEFNPAPSHAITALARRGSTLYVGGSSRFLGPASPRSLAAVDATTGSLVPEFNADLGFDDLHGGVDQILVRGTTLYIVGEFSSVGGQARTDVAAIDAGTGGVTPFRAKLEPYREPSEGMTRDVLAKSIAVSGETLFVGGTFARVDGQPRRLLAGLDVETGSVQPFNADIDGTVPPNFERQITSLAVSGSRLYFGGDFSSVGGLSRARLASVEISTGTPTGWNPSLTFEEDPYAGIDRLTTDGSTVFVGGDFRKAGGQDRAGLAAFDSESGTVRSWDPKVSSRGPSLGGGYGALIAGGGTVVIGGAFAGAGEPISSQSRLLRLRRDGSLDSSWNPQGIPGPVTHIAVGPDAVYAATSDGWTAGAFVAYSKTSGASAVAPSGSPFNGVNDMLVARGKLIVAGYGASRRLAEFDLTTGQMNSWQPVLTKAGQPDGAVTRLGVVGNTLYVAGTFDAINGVHRKGLAAIDLDSHALTAFAPAEVFDQGDPMLAIRENAIYGSRNAVDLGTGTSLPWNPPLGGLRAVSSGPAGLFGVASVGVDAATDDYRTMLARINPSNGSVEAELLPSPTGLSQVIVGSDELLVTGSMIAVGPVVTGPYARLRVSGTVTPPPANTVRPTISGVATVGSLLVCDPGQWTAATPATYSYEWLRDGLVIGVPSSSDGRYTIAGGDAGHSLACRVRVETSSGSGTATSSELAIPQSVTPPPGAPMVVPPPVETLVIPPSVPLPVPLDPVAIPEPKSKSRPSEPRAPTARLDRTTVKPGKTLTVRLANLPNKARLTVWWKPARGKVIRRTVSASKGRAQAAAPNKKGRYRVTVSYKGRALVRNTTVVVR